MEKKTDKTKNMLALLFLGLDFIFLLQIPNLFMFHPLAHIRHFQGFCESHLKHPSL